MQLRAMVRNKWLILSLTLVMSAFGYPGSEAQSLRPGAVVERRLAADATDRFDIVLREREFLRLVIEQKESKVSATLSTPDGRELLIGSAPMLSSFMMAAVAEAAGQYHVELRPTVSRSQPRYRLRMEALRNATPDDDRAAQASRVFHEANRLLAQVSPTPPPVASAFDDAAKRYRDALAQFTSLGDREDEAAALLNLGFISARQNALDDAEQFLDRGATLSKALGDDESLAYALVQKAVLNRQRGRYGQTLSDAAQALEIERDRGNVSGQRFILAMLADVCSQAGRDEEAITYLKQILEMEQSPNTAAAAQDLENIAVRYWRLNQHRTSITYRTREAQIYRDMGDTKNLARTLSWLSDGYRALGEPKLALPYATEAAKLSQKPVDHHLLAELGQYETAIEIVRAAIAESSGRTEADNWSQLASVYERTNQRAAALDSLREALRILENLPEAPEAIAMIAIQFHDLGEDRKALELFDKYLKAMDRLGPEESNRYPVYPNFLNSVARTERDLGLLDRARTHLQTALSIREIARSQIASLELSASFFSRSRPIYDTYVDVLMRQHSLEPDKGHDAEALAAAERGRAHAFVASLGDTISRIREGIDPQLIEQERSIRDRLNEAALLQQQAASDSRRSKQAQTAALDIQQLSAELELLHGKIRRSNPQYAALTQPDTLDLAGIQNRVLAPGTMLLEYSLGLENDASYVWAVTTNSVKGFALPPRTEIEKTARRLYELLTARQLRPKGETQIQRSARLRRADRDYAVAATALSRAIIGPVANLIRGQRLLIVADGALAYVPFQALPDPRTGTALVTSHEFVRLPSATALAVLRESSATRRRAPRNLAVFADPVFDAHDERFGAKRNSTSQSFPDSLQRTLTETGIAALPRLSFSRLEADSITMAAPQGSVFRALDFRANKSVATSSDLSNYRIVHFATHGILDTEAPTLSGIVLSLVDREGKPQDGFLRLHEIYNLHLNADLVVLSACQTALGREIVGEGVIGLTRGFLYAGARRVMASLWTVDDRGTAELMGRFYHKLLSEHMTAAAALRATQLEMQQSERWSSPYYWAAFELQGEWK